MAEQIVSDVLEQLSSILSKQREAKVSLVTCVDEEVQMLIVNFRAIRAVLADAESRQVTEDAVRLWLEELRRTSHDITQLLDKWNTAIQKLQIKEVGKASMDKRIKVCSPVPYCFSPKQLVLRHEIAKKMKYLNKKLDKIAKEKENFSFSSMNLSDEPVPVTVTAPSDESKTYGRDQDKSRIINLLLSESNHEQTSENLPIISIVGVGGLGKTTLARLVYNDDKVDSYFDVKTWVYVSKRVDAIQIAREILNSLNGNATDSNATSLHELIVFAMIPQLVKGKKFLLVLDDVLIEDPKYWDIVMRLCLESASQGSRILMTTRYENTAKAIRTTSTISPGKLSDQECLSWFSEVAFPGRTKEERENLEKIGREIILKCDGLPLAVKAVGSVLSKETKFERWQLVLDNKIWELEDTEKVFCLYLLLNYNNLPLRLKKCVSYYTLFPKDYVIDKDELIKLWIAQSYFEEEKGTEMELVGENCFDHLASLELFQKVESGFGGNRTRWKTHNLVRDFVRFITDNECFTTESQFHKAQHLVIIGSSDPVALDDEKNLRSLIVKKPGNREDLFKFYQFTCLRTLELSGCSIEKIQKGIKELIHLRYLNLSHNVKIEELPETICELRNLQTLNISNCYCLRKLPHGMGKLINLRHLINHGTCLTYMPKGLQRLTHLRQLSKFVVTADDRKASTLERLAKFDHILQVSKKFVVGADGDDRKACTLEYLAKFNHLRGFLLITGLGNVSDVDKINKGKLEDKENLLGLGLRFEVRNGRYAEDKNFLEVLELPPNLQELMIQYYIGKTMSLNRIMMLDKLRVLKLSCCFEFEGLPPLGKLSSLESLMIWNMPSVKSVGNEFLGVESGSPSSFSLRIFPKLKYLAIWNMEEWEEWKDYSFIIPCLYSLKLHSCPKLKDLPGYIINPVSPLKKLELKSCHFLEERYGRRTEPGLLTFRFLPEILIIDESKNSTSSVNVDKKYRSPDGGSKGKMPIELPTDTIGMDPEVISSYSPFVN